MTTRLSEEFRRRLLYGEPLGEVTLTVHVDAAQNGWADLRFTLDDKDGRELAQVAAAQAQEGASISLTRLHRAFDVKIS